MKMQFVLQSQASDPPHSTDGLLVTVVHRPPQPHAATGTARPVVVAPASASVVARITGRLGVDKSVVVDTVDDCDVDTGCVLLMVTPLEIVLVLMLVLVLVLRSMLELVLVVPVTSTLIVVGAAVMIIPPSVAVGASVTAGPLPVHPIST
jgi:hypothetical protein